MKNLVILIASMILAASCSAYQVSDLPAGWGIDPNQVEGTLLPAYSGGLPADDPNTWLMPIGSFTRTGGTNGWVAGLSFVSANPPASSSLSLHHDPDYGFSTTWQLDGWVRPGPNYLMIDAWSWPMWSLIVPRTRYTIVVVGVAPEGTEAILE